eukprot:gene39020-51323_t
MFRAAFHTGYVPHGGVLRLTKSQLDGANIDARIPEDFFIDLIFAPVETTTTPANNNNTNTPTTTASNDNNTTSTSSATVSSATQKDSQAPMEFTPVGDGNSNGTGNGTGTGTSKLQQPTDSGLVLDPNSKDRYEQMLHRDVRFWEAVASRKLRGKRRRARKFVSNAQDRFSISDDTVLSSKDVTDGDGMNGGGGGGDGSNVMNNTDLSHNMKQNNSGISDLELIMQLAIAEGDEFDSFDNHNNGGGGGDTN